MTIRLTVGEATGLDFNNTWWDRWLGMYETFDATGAPLGTREVRHSTTPGHAYELVLPQGVYQFDATDTQWTLPVVPPITASLGADGYTLVFDAFVNGIQTLKNVSSGPDNTFEALGRNYTFGDTFVLGGPCLLYTSPSPRDRG